MKKRKIYGYLCGVDFQHEAGESSDYPLLYNSPEALKKDRVCWEQCGIVQVELKLVKWVELQNFDFEGKDDYVDG